MIAVIAAAVAASASLPVIRGCRWITLGKLKHRVFERAHRDPPRASRLLSSFSCPSRSINLFL